MTGEAVIARSGSFIRSVASSLGGGYSVRGHRCDRLVGSSRGIKGEAETAVEVSISVWGFVDDLL